MNVKIVGYSRDGLSAPLLANRKVKKFKPAKCCYCDIQLTQRIGNVKPTDKTMDHIHPKSLGGTLKKPCCFACNSEKADFTLKQYIGLLRVQRIGKVYLSDEWNLITKKIDNCLKLIKEHDGIKIWSRWPN